MSTVKNQYTKRVSLGRVKDGGFFTRTGRNNAPVYEMQTKKRGLATYTSVESGLTFTRPIGESAFIKP